ncbi:GMC family oxidoreductase [Alloacidobacterium dinghuense]|uniref:GMC family oxidoreductase n=1 Tax=Alloacidobacterium dinghuense TaxID=2763107 RepID=A0A7G8BCB7_9BACT|nr:GMC family oxidoreductase [Alloacidobacterium dinghuense]QNI30187.1 GMC family oxidoreductase [Alloacidobacterium dinghuense]
MANNASNPAQDSWDYIVVGSGAGGGTVAARLAEAGYTVLLLEAGSDCKQPLEDGAREPGAERLPADYDVPCFHTFASENEAMRWDFFVRHYSDAKAQQLDPKYREINDGQRVDGVLYPRAGTLGGCTAHNAMIFVYPHDDDWDGIAELTGDNSWNSENMRRYFERLENCHHREPERLLAQIGMNPSRHGWHGWLHTECAIPLSALLEKDLRDVLIASIKEAVHEMGYVADQVEWSLQGLLDPNDWRTVRANSIGLHYMPLTTKDHARIGTRERVLEVAARHPDRLHTELNALATRVLFDENRRAIGVEYLKGQNLYKAHAHPNMMPGVRRTAYAQREVILAGGAFNTPQLLMLSGIGPAEELQRHGIEVCVDLAGVGKNLQDRYEIGVVNRMNFEEWEIFEGAEFSTGDSQYDCWDRSREGAYTTNGTLLSMYKRSAPERPLPDLFCLAVLGRFEGYFPGYSRVFATNRNYLTWAVLKAHTNNRAGRVTLRSADPLDMPEVNFHYFEEGTPDDGQDLDSVVDGIRFVRKLTDRLRRKDVIAEETLPGETLQSDDELRQYVRNNAWGHHASCTCAIGPRESGGVLDSHFRVHGTIGLRVVDASVFPRIPGFFIACAVYMIGEKAADVILEDARPLTESFD